MNKLKHIYIYICKRLYIYIHIKKCTNKNAYILDLYTEKKHVATLPVPTSKTWPPKNPCRIAKPEVFGWTFGGKNFTSDPSLYG